MHMIYHGLVWKIIVKSWNLVMCKQLKFTCQYLETFLTWVSKCVLK